MIQIPKKISIIIITRNRANFVARAIESAQKQNFTDWELLILDDDSNDNTKTIIETYINKDSRIKYHKNSPALGISKNRNKGVSLSRGEYIAMLDSDDYWIDNNKLQKQIEILEKNKNIGLIGSNIICVDKEDKKLNKSNYKTKSEDIKQKILINNQFAQSSIVFRKDILNQVGGYNEKLDVCEDLDLWLKIGRFCDFANIKDVTTAYMVHPGGISKQRKFKMAKNMLDIIEINKNYYPNYIIAKIIAILRILKSLF
ncbi:MAG: glycosyltransferase [Candidatus Paceibacterota bacterium]|jgi:glycosyltransferase involved in cell wall biosynthesis